MPGYVLTRRARRDLLEIIEYVSDANVAAADELQRVFFRAFALLGENPGLGHARPDLTRRTVRFLTVRKSYLVIHYGAAPVRVIRVLHGYRNLGGLLG